ncbi:MAG TPA: DUF2382 domain-containing protein [Candidatus Caenarcaniphilales bacterium]
MFTSQEYRQRILSELAHDNVEQLNQVPGVSPENFQSARKDSTLRPPQVQSMAEAEQLVAPKQAEAGLTALNERIVERVLPHQAKTTVLPAEANFYEGEVMRIEVYEDTVDIHKQVFVHQQIKIHKEIERSLITAEAEILREELDVENRSNQPLAEPEFCSEGDLLV